MSRKYTAIVNPAACSEKAGKLSQKLKKVARETTLELSDSPKSAIQKAAQAVQRGSEVIIAVGGDGTINEVINGIFGAPVTLGVMPLGTANVFARQLGIPLDIQKAWEVIEKGLTRTIDVIKVEYHERDKPQCRYFVQVAGVGLDAYVVKQVTWEAKKKWGSLAYIFETFKVLKNHKFSCLSVKIDGSDSRECAFMLIGNGVYYGGSFSIFNQALLDDGLIDICLFDSTRFLDLMFYGQAILRGLQVITDGMIYRQCRTIEIISPHVVPFELDGEFIGYSPVKFTVISKALKIFVPRTRELS